MEGGGVIGIGAVTVVSVDGPSGTEVVGDAPGLDGEDICEVVVDDDDEAGLSIVNLGLLFWSPPNTCGAR